MSEKYTILLVENEQSVVNTIVTASKNYNEFEIIATTDLMSVALDLIRAKRPKVIISDVQLTDGSALKLIRQIKKSTEFSDYNPYLVGITSYASQHLQQQLKDLVDYVHIKNSHFNVKDIFTELQYAIQSIESNKLAPLSKTNHKEKKIEDAVLDVLGKFYINPKKERHQRCIIKIISLTLEQNIDDFKLLEFYRKVAPSIGLKNANAVSSLMTRYLDEMIQKTDDAILEQAFKYCYDPTAPTAGEFFIVITKIVKSKLK